MSDIKKLADGIEYKLDGDAIIFRVYLNKKVGDSASGKTSFNANTHGWADLNENLRVNIMVGTPNTKPKAKKTIKKLEM